MILPKGNLEFQRMGGEDAVKDVIEMIEDGEMTGYVLVLGKLESMEGELDDLTGQIVFKEGSPVLCESVLRNISHKGKGGIHLALKSMLTPDSNIEFKSIDVDPPMAFFKECLVDDASIDIPDFMQRIREDEEEKHRMEEERNKRDEKKREISETVEEWISKGFEISDYPAILKKEFEEIEEWYSNISGNMLKIEEHRKWLEGVDEIEVETERKNLLDMLNDPGNIREIESEKKKFEDLLKGFEEKRTEIMKWVNLWKDEGYNTIQIEDKLKHDIQTAWNAMTQFMDDIQQLKDGKTELDKIREMDGSKGFGKEIRDIDFLLNDPAELENIKQSLEVLRKSITEEDRAKNELMHMAEEIEKKGYDISHLREIFAERLAPFRERFNLIMNNTLRITEIRQELQAMDHTDIGEDIDGFLKETSDPMKLDEYETKLLELKDRVSELSEQRGAIISEIESIKDQGFDTRIFEEKFRTPLDQLRAFRKDFMNKITELRELKERVAPMDRRWLEDEFSELDEALTDPSRIEWARKRIGELHEMIDRRETLREKAASDLEAWEKEGFLVDMLREVVNEDLDDFDPVHKELSRRIEEERELLSGLDSLDARYFQNDLEVIRGHLLDPAELENSREEIKGLEKRIEEDRKQRKGLEERMKTLRAEGWSVEGLEGMLEVPPGEVKSQLEVLEVRVYKLGEKIADIENWDPLETNWMAGGIEELKTHLHRLSDLEGAMEHFETLKGKVISNREKRMKIKAQISDWKEAGYITKKATPFLEKDMETLEKAFEELKGGIQKLEELQKEFDSLDTRHFAKEGEEIEFKLNDPDLTDEIEASMVDLREKIEEDRNKRDQFLRTIDDYMEEGFMGAEKLKDVLEEDISIVDLEFKNFQKEVDLFRKTMEKVGFVFRGEKKQEHKKKD